VQELPAHASVGNDPFTVKPISQSFCTKASATQDGLGWQTLFRVDVGERVSCSSLAHSVMSKQTVFEVEVEAAVWYFDVPSHAVTALHCRFVVGVKAAVS